MNTLRRPAVHAHGLEEVSFDFLSAYLRGRRSRLYEGDALQRLRQLPGLAELAHRLFPMEAVRGQPDLERLLAAACAADLIAVSRFVAGPCGRLYRALVDRFRVENAKVLLRLLGREDAPKAAEELLVPLPEEWALDAAELLASSRPSEFLSRLPFAVTVDRAPEGLIHQAGPESRAAAEMVIDAGYWRRVTAALDRLAPWDLAACAAPVVAELAALRLVAVLRAARNYGIAWDVLAPLLPAGRGGICDRDLRAIHQHPEPATVLARLAPLSKALPAPEAEQAHAFGVDFVGRVEDALWESTMAAADRQYYNPPGGLFGPATLVSYFYLKRQELRSLVQVAQLLRRAAGA
jgi:vacuolar-type H+-ATPase subunit C/Vma6